MPTTSYGYPFPSPTDVPDVPTDIQELAEKVDDNVAVVRGGVATVPSSGSFSATVAITFGGFGSGIPAMVATIAGTPTKRIVRVDSITASSAVLSVHTSDGTALGTATTVYWVATTRRDQT